MGVGLAGGRLVGVGLAGGGEPPAGKDEEGLGGFSGHLVNKKYTLFKYELIV